VLLAGAIAAGSALRGGLIAGKRTLSHDEAISYLSAAGKQGLYQERAGAGAAPFGTLAHAAELKALMRPDEPLCLERIARDLAETDIHPPLYFWLLHLWVLITGVHLWSGPVLNVLIAGAAAAALYALACAVLRERLAAAVVAALWVTSPAVIEMAVEARQYDLLALSTIGFAWSLLRYVDGAEARRGRYLVFLTLATLAGLLTHYHFGLLIAAGYLWLAVRLRHQPRRLLAGLAGMAAGVVAFVLIHPRFMASVLRARPQSAEPGELDVLGRLECLLETYSNFLTTTAHNAWLVHKYLLPASAAFVLGVGLCGWVMVRRSRVAGYAFGERSVVYFFLAMAGANAVLYLSGVSPRHAMAARYLAMIWPFLAFLPVLVVNRISGPRTPLMLLLVAAMAGSDLAGVQRSVARWRALPEPQRTFEQAPTVVIDNVARGVLLPIVWHVPDECPVLAAPESRLLEDDASRLAGLEAGTVVVTVALYDNTPATQEEFVQTLAGRRAINPVDGTVFGAARILVLGGE
jgi:hypothetical protein